MSGNLLSLYKHSILKSSYLRNLRSQLRQIIVIATNNEINRLMELEKKRRSVSSSHSNEEITIYRNRRGLQKALLSSICICANSAICVSLYEFKSRGIVLPEFITDLDMVWDSNTENWFCVNCFNILKSEEEIC